MFGTTVGMASRLERLAQTLSFWHRSDMPRGYSRDLRERLLRARASGLSAAEITRTTGVSTRSLQRWAKRQAAGGSLTPGAAPGPAPKIGPDVDAMLRAQVAAHPDATLAEHCATWAETHPAVSVATMSRTLQRLGLPLKKNADRYRAKR